jgi:2-oxoglutarate dehydrogenase complex dehydrogenase (E1) component-like enzyme
MVGHRPCRRGRAARRDWRRPRKVEGNRAAHHHPEGFTPHKTIAHRGNRRKMIEEGSGIDWATAIARFPRC